MIFQTNFMIQMFFSILQTAITKGAHRKYSQYGNVKEKYYHEYEEEEEDGPCSAFYNM